SGSPQAVVLSGSGVSSSTTGPAVSLSPTSLAFGNQTVGTTSAVQYATRTNTGHATQTLSGGFRISGDFDFAGLATCARSGAARLSRDLGFGGLGTCGRPGAAGGKCTVSGKLAPPRSGTRHGGRTLKRNGPNTPQKDTPRGAGT